MTDSAENNIFLKIIKFSFGLGWFPHFKFFSSYGLKCNSSFIILEYSELQNIIIETLQTFIFGKQAFDVLWLILPHSSDALMIGL